MPYLGIGSIVMKDRATVLLAKPVNGPDAGRWVIPGEIIDEQETTRNAAIRVVQEIAGIEVDAKQSLFFCEDITPELHRISLFCLAVPTREAEIIAGLGYSEVKWVDVRELAKVQNEEGMSDFTAQAFLKFSDYLRAQAQATMANVESGTVN